MTSQKFAIKKVTQPKFLGEIERGEKNTSLETVIKAANALNIPVDVLLSDLLDRKLEIKRNAITESISELPDKEQLKIFAILETMIEQAKL